VSAPLSDFLLFQKYLVLSTGEGREIYKKPYEIQVFQSINRSYPQTQDHRNKLYYPEIPSVNVSLLELLVSPCVLGGNHTAKAQKN